jgi:hypothetical protein
VGVHLLNLDLFEGHPSPLWHFELRDRHHPAVRLGDELQLHRVELRKADRAMRRGQGALPHPALAAWVAFLEHWKEARTMSDVQYAPVQEAMKRLEQLSLSQEERFRALARERALLDEATLRWEATEGKAQARREGVAEGRVEGRSRAKAETLTRLLTHRFGALPDWAEPLIASASETQLDAWLDGIFEAQSVRGLIAPGE